MNTETITIKFNLSSANVKTIIEDGVMTIVIVNNNDVSPIEMVRTLPEPEVVGTSCVNDEVKKFKVVYDEDLCDDDEDLCDDDETRTDPDVSAIKNLIDEIERSITVNSYKNYFAEERYRKLDDEFSTVVTKMEEAITDKINSQNKDYHRDMEYGYLAREGEAWAEAHQREDEAQLEPVPMRAMMKHSRKHNDRKMVSMMPCRREWVNYTEVPKRPKRVDYRKVPAIPLPPM